MIYFIGSITYEQVDELFEENVSGDQVESDLTFMFAMLGKFEKQEVKDHNLSLISKRKQQIMAALKITHYPKFAGVLSTLKEKLHLKKDFGISCQNLVS